MSERALDEFLNFLEITLEERRTLKILFGHEKPIGADEIKKQYEKIFVLNAGNF